MLTREQIEEWREEFLAIHQYRHDRNQLDTLCDMALRSLDAQQNDVHSDSALSGGNTEPPELVALRLILPMAKAYAYAHDVGGNVDKVQHAEVVLEELQHREVLKTTRDANDPNGALTAAREGKHE